tara:strand:- start:154 stop:423 length:270 start_codon:yes stop_codon:yes gene_type:complete
MKLAKIIGTVTSTAKDPSLIGETLLICDIIDGQTNSIGQNCIAADTVGAGTGDIVLIANGSAARVPKKTTGKPIDAAIIAVVDKATISK